MTVQSYRGLVAWQKAMDLVKSVYAAAKKFPKEELFGLSSQLKRATVSIPSNIAEGQGRNSTKEFLHHLAIAYGSLMEVETQIIISGDLNFLGYNRSPKPFTTNCRGWKTYQRSFKILVQQDQDKLITDY